MIKRNSLFKKCIASVMCLVVGALSLTACDIPGRDKENDGKLNIVTTIFPSYDFAKELCGDGATVTMLLKPGQESHTYEPTAQDILAIEKCDLFIYVGGENDKWVEDILESFDEPVDTVRMIDFADTCTDSHDEDSHDHEGHEHETDEHVWTSPKNAISITQGISEKLCEIDSENKDKYEQNCDSYVKELEALCGEIQSVVDSSKRKTLVFGDRFPFVYFARDFGLDCYAAFEGCSTETEPSAQTMASLIERINAENIPVVLYIEFSAQTVADSIAEQTGCRSLLFHSCHNVTDEEIENGATYLSLMRGNIEVLKEALN